MAVFRPGILAAAPAAALALALAPAAHAASLTVDYGAHSLTYVAAAGEANRLSVAFDPSTVTYTVSDPGAASIRLAVTGGPASSCSQSPAAVVCSAYGIHSHSISLGDYDDTLSMTTDMPVTVYGGNGADTLQTGTGADTLVGGNGPDVLIGGGGGDTYEGGNGPDTVDYSAATTPVSVSEDGVANDGTDGTDDVSADVESAIGGSAADVLHAGPSGGTLQGGPGDDTLYGSAEDDVLDGGPGSDAIFGGGGDDRILAEDGSADAIDCGEGSDTVTNDALDAVAANCEVRDAAPDATLPAGGSGDGSGSAGAAAPGPPGGSAAGGAPDILLPVRPVAFTAPNVLRVRLRCAADAAAACRGDLSVEVPARYLVRSRAPARRLQAARGHYVAQSRRIAHRKFLIARGRVLSAQVRVALRGHYVLLNRHRIRGRLRIVQRDAAGKVLGVTTRPIVLDRKWSRRNRH